MFKGLNALSRKNTATCVLLLGLFIIGTGCTTVQHRLEISDDYQPKPNIRFEVGAVTNTSGKRFDIDVEKRFAEALTKKLRKADLAWSGSGTPRIEVTTEIVYYEKGNAFTRWLAPGQGTTWLIVHCQLLENNKVIGTADAKRAIYAGGGYTIGAWSYVFPDVAADIVADLKRRRLAKRL